MKNYSFEFETPRSSSEVFGLLLQAEIWWSGIFEETFTGRSKEMNDEFTFSAGGGLHFSRQKLVERIPYSRIVWEVTESNLSFLDNPHEWEHTRIQFDLLENAEQGTLVRFTHEGLVPEMACYNQCSAAWSQYMENLRNKLK